MRVRLSALLLVASLGVVLAANPRPGWLTPQEEQKHFKVGDGLQVELYASEPHSRQPVTIGFDDRGRMWVVQYLQYPNPAGLKAVSEDQYLRTKYDRVPEPPPKGPRGADRVTILEDTDGDGVIDKSKDFVTGLNLASGLALGHGGAFVLQTPYLLFYPDRDGDDVPDGDPEVCVKGFGMEDAHAVANSLTWGPDGWLYGAQGSTVTAKIGGVEFQQGVWRYHPLTKKFELFAEGGGNAFGLEFDRYGNVYSAGNEYELMVHHVQGAYYVKGFGKHGPLHNPHAYGYFNPVKHYGYIGDSLSGGAIIYQGGAFPEKFRDACIAPYTRHNAIRWSSMAREGSTVATHFGGDFLTSDDKWFRPVDQTVGPDGAVYVADWYDVNISHSDPTDRSKWYKPSKDDGRVWRVVPQGSHLRPSEKLPLRKLSSDDLIDLFSHPNDWYAREARRLLAERRDKTVLPRLRDMIFTAKDERLQLQALWGLYVTGGFDDTLAARLLDHPFEYVRSWTVRLIGDERKAAPDLQKKFVTLARTDPSAIVRSQLACTAKRLPGKDGLPVVEQLLRRSDDAKDTFIPLLLWWAVEDKALSDRDQVVRLLESPEAWKLPLVRGTIVERMARRYAAEGTDLDYATCARLLATAPGPEEVNLVVVGMEQALSGRRLERVPPALAQPLSTLLARADVTPATLRLGVRLGSDDAFKRVLHAVADPKTPEADRLGFLETVGQSGKTESVPVLLDLLRQSKAEPTRQAALAALQRFDADLIAARVLELFPKMSPALQAASVGLLSGRKNWSLALLSAVDAGKLDSKQVSVDQVRQILLHQDPRLKKLVEKHWGQVRTSTLAEKRGQIQGLLGMLAQGPGDLARGKALYTQHCATCHKLYGEGNDVGPELTAVERKNREFLLANIVDPNLMIRPQYTAYVVTTKNGRVLTGLLAESTPDTVTILDAKNVRTVLSRKELDEMAPSPVSLMPEDLLKPLNPQEARDLFQYLQSDPPAAAKKAAGK